GIKEMKERLAEVGRDPSDLQVTGTLRLVKADDGSLDLDRTMEQVPTLAEAGLTDARAAFPLPDDPSARLDALSEIVATFRAAAARDDGPQREWGERAGGGSPALRREHLRLHRHAAGGGEAADATTGREHAVARDHDRVRVAAQSLTDGTRRARRPRGRRHLAV